MIYLKQSTASQEVPIGVFVDDTDGKTAETGLTIANTDIKVWKSGATTLANKNSGGATHIAGGVYYAVLDATDTDTVGPLTLFVHVSGALPCKVDCCVLAANVYDSLIAGSEKLDVDTYQVTANALTASALAADAATEIADAVLSRDLDQVEGTAPIHSLTGAALKLVGRVDDDGAGSLVTYKTNGTDAFSKQAITTGASLEPIDSLGTATTP